MIKDRSFLRASVSKQVYVQNPSYENKFDLHENEPMNSLFLIGFALRLVLIQRQKATWKITIGMT